MWEHEAWSHIVDIDKQEGEALNNLMIFVRLANTQFEEVKKAAQQAGHGQYFAASKYTVDFYDSHETTDRHIRLKNKNSSMLVSKDSGYKSSELYLDRKISTAKMKSATKIMREKKQNVLYKGFESVFLKSKTKSNKHGK